MNVYSGIKIMSPKRLTSTIITGILFTVVCLTWGTTWLGIKIAVETAPPLLASGLRFVIAFPFLLLLLKLFHSPLFFPKDKLGFFVLLTIGYFSVPYFLLSYGEQYVYSGLTSLLFSTMPVFSILFSRLLLNIKIKLNQVIGIAIGFISLLMILRSQGLGFNFTELAGVLAILASAVMHGFLYVYSKKTAGDIDIFTFNTLPIGLSGLLLCLCSIVFETPDFGEISTNSWLALIYLGVVASVGGFVLYFYMLKRMSPVILSFIFIIFPVVALVIDGWYTQTPLSNELIGYSLLMLFGFSLTKLTSSKTKPDVLD
ncbi:MAG: EamA family transporter [Gammaproteobacteria bacterium]|nr:MAG: EamA family transporter [Gammaproteobacteria bacterium]